ncbi:MAG: IS110 family transposase, partial [Nitrospirae bacterium]
MMRTQVFVGIDVSKAQLDVAFRPEGRVSVPNDEAGCAQVLERLRAVPPTLVVLEATGGLEIPLTGVLAAAVMRPELRPLPDEQTQALAAILARRRQLVEMLTAEKNRLGSAPKPVRKSLRTHIAWLERELRHTDSNLAHAIRESPVWREKDALLRSTPGVGPVMTTTLLANLPELGTLTGK